MNVESPLAKLISTRTAEFGLDAQHLGFRLGYRSPAKASGRVTALTQGNIFSQKSRVASDRPAHALEVPDQTLKQAVVATERVIAEDHLPPVGFYALISDLSGMGRQYRP